jgi:hypothetical protein
MAKKIKAKAPKSAETKDLEPKNVKDVQGGKAGTGQQDYLKITLKDILVS